MKYTKLSVRQSSPEFPNYKKSSGISGLFTFMFAVLFWLLAGFLFLCFLYISWFTRSCEYLVSLFSDEHILVPFWFGLVLVIFFFPITLFVVLLASFVKIMRN